MIRFDHRAVPIVLAAVTVDVIGFGIVMPVLPALVTELGRVDLPEATRIAGWMLAVFAIGQFVAGPVLGNLGDRYGRRPVLIAAMVGFALDYLLMAAAPSLMWLFVGRAIAGVCGATFGPAGAVIADVSTPERRAQAFGLLGAAFGIGFIVGPALGGLVAGWGVRAPFVVAAALAALNALTMLLFLPETLKPENRRPFRLADAHVVGAFRPLFAAGNAAPLLVAWFLWQLGGVVYPTVWSFWATLRFGWDAGQIGWSLAWVGFLQLLVQVFVTGRAVRRLGERAAAVIGLVAGAATLVAYAFTTQGWQVYAFFLVGAFGALAWPAMNGMLSRLVDATRQGALQGGLGSMNSVAAIVGPLLAAQSLAWGAGRGFDGLAFLLAGVLIAAAALIVAFLVPTLRASQGDSL
ncbi:TCR/Tet family MFS transporter [Sphingomonas corticis]|jgi:DHA1 family tetracycline resistance protein-like MFS transporter|uniref:TCR/Tet family MFS transporter n=1 Tax=Sphingomonas corticis TaxID=2722791 RepID=A0ABX1CHJ8_9SPHN|nr:TCR/Tet family MFS transporter [Sphingomonas corticis]NJR77489.1 TCR/Tet family MFS transporter [Sphingomonas corticis]